MSKKEKKDAAFIEKIKSIGINTSKGAHPSTCACPFCGKSHPIPKGVVAYGFAHTIRPEKPKNEETAFAA